MVGKSRARRKPAVESRATTQRHTLRGRPELEASDTTQAQIISQPDSAPAGNGGCSEQSPATPDLKEDNMYFESMNLPALLDTKLAAQVLDSKEQTLCVWRSTKRYDLPYIKIGGKVRYRREAVLKFLADREIHPVPAAGPGGVAAGLR